MFTLIETTGGKVLAHGVDTFTNDPRYDAGVHTILTNNEEKLIPFNPLHDDTYHSWNGSAFVINNATQAEKDEQKANEADAIILKDTGNGNIYKYESVNGVFTGTQIG